MLPRDSSLTIVERIRRDRAFAKGVLSEAATLFLGGEPEVARLMLRDVVNGTLGFEELSSLTGNPAMDNLAAIFEAITGHLKIEVEARAKKAA
ncbi:transcriptional regulator [Parvibaculum sp.]|jgi:hypothetical protein|uniref:transcriptional regulator n=1 Tax=Parvibaculum sp. TaxID=2024848 RepID=UPI00329993FF